MTTLQFLPGALAGSAAGFKLGLVGGGGSILAVPLIYSSAWTSRTWRSARARSPSRPMH